MTDTNIEQFQQQIKNLNAQSDATKQMFNEAMASNLQLRTNLNLFQQMHHENIQLINSLKAQVEELNTKLGSVPAPEVPAAE